MVTSTIVRLHGSETIEVMSEVQPCNSTQLLQVCLAYLMLFIMITMPPIRQKMVQNDVSNYNYSTESSEVSAASFFYVLVLQNS